MWSELLKKTGNLLSKKLSNFRAAMKKIYFYFPEKGWDAGVLQCKRAIAGAFSLKTKIEKSSICIG